MKKLFLTMAVILGIGVPSAHAVPVSINVDELYDWGRLYSHSGTNYTTTNSNPAYYGGGSDTAIGTVRPENTVGQADGKEDTWGIGSVASITSIPPGTNYFQRSASQELTLMFQGFDDDFLSAPSILGATQLLSVGGHLQVYLDNTPDFNGSLGTAGRTGQASYTGATDGILVLDLAPVAFDGFGHTLESNFNFLTSSGSGALFLAVTGNGLWDSLYDTNTQLFGSDFSFSFTVRDNVNPAIGDWIVRGDAGGESNVVPEPASMILFGSSFLGMVGARLRKRTQA